MSSSTHTRSKGSTNLAAAKRKKRSTRAAKPKKLKLINYDQCDSCGDGGDLLCCDECPLSFHLHCLDPPLERVPEGDWSCQKCVSKQFETIPHEHSSFGPAITALRTTNPSVFSFPQELRREIFDKYSMYSAGDKQKIHDTKCHVCQLDTNQEALAKCSSCTKVYHIWCLDPQLPTTPPATWKCPIHAYGSPSHPSNYALSDHCIDLDFFPYDKLPTTSFTRNRRTRLPPLRTPASWKRKRQALDGLGLLAAIEREEVEKEGASRGRNSIPNSSPTTSSSSFTSSSYSRPSSGFQQATTQAQPASSTFSQHQQNATQSMAKEDKGEAGERRAGSSAEPSAKLLSQVLQLRSSLLEQASEPMLSSISAAEHRSLGLLPKLTPLFTQFLAFQRLVQIHNQLGPNAPGLFQQDLTDNLTQNHSHTDKKVSKLAVNTTNNHIRHKSPHEKQDHSVKKSTTRTSSLSGTRRKQSQSPSKMNSSAGKLDKKQSTTVTNKLRQEAPSSFKRATTTANTRSSPVKGTRGSRRKSTPSPSKSRPNTNRSSSSRSNISNNVNSKTSSTPHRSSQYLVEENMVAE